MRINSPVTQVEHHIGPSANILSTTDTKSRIKYISDDFIAVSGYSEQELLDQPHNIVRHPDMPKEAFARLWSQLRSGNSWMGLVKNRCKNGDHYWVDAYATPIGAKDEVGEYQSVRTRPEREYVNRADALYARLRAGKKPKYLHREALSLRARLLLILLPLELIYGIALSELAGLDLTPLTIGVLTMSLVTALCVHWLLRPLSGLIDDHRHLCADPVARQVYSGRHDEAGKLKLIMKSLKSETGAIVGRKANFSAQLPESVSRINTSMEGINQQVGMLNSDTEQAAAAITEMSASIQEVSRNAQNTATAANRAKNDASGGLEFVDHTTREIASLAQDVQQSTAAIQAVEQQTSAISGVIDVIRSVAEQTNLLALNAAIEAARAGEQGRGFAVVADEVRTLANRTHKSTQEIMSTIENLQADAHNAVKIMEAVAVKAATLVSRSTDTMRSIEGVNDQIGVISDMNIQIAAAVEQQSCVSEEIQQNISRINDLADEIKRNSNSSEALCRTSYRFTTQLQQLAEQFWMAK